MSSFTLSATLAVLCLYFACVEGQTTNCPTLVPQPDLILISPCSATPMTQCTFQCRAGLELVGWATLSCQKNGRWSDILPRCIRPGARVCPSLGSCQNYVDGAFCNIVCYLGDHVIGAATATCEVNKWIPQEPRWKQNQALATCIPDNAARSCADPIITNGRFPVKCGLTDGSKCNYTCDDGYLPNTQMPVICNSARGGSWSEYPECVRNVNNRCTQPGKPRRGDFVQPCTTTITSVCQFKCDNGYQIRGAPTIFCLKTGKWTANPPRCVRIGGGEPDCATIRIDDETKKSGVYTITLKKTRKQVEVYCDMDTDRGGWTVFQRRTSKGGKSDFFLNWAPYKDGFGERDSEFWLGNDNIHELTASESQVLRIDMENEVQQKRYAEYRQFNVADESRGYELDVGQYSGTAGDSLTQWQNDRKFSTKGQPAAGSQKCVRLFKGGWWYGTYPLCHYSNLNGYNYQGYHTTYADGINWFTFMGYYYSLRRTEMKMRPEAFKL